MFFSAYVMYIQKVCNSSHTYPRSLSNYIHGTTFISTMLSNLTSYRKSQDGLKQFKLKQLSPLWIFKHERKQHRCFQGVFTCSLPRISPFKVFFLYICMIFIFCLKYAYRRLCTRKRGRCFPMFLFPSHLR